MYRNTYDLNEFHFMLKFLEFLSLSLALVEQHLALFTSIFLLLLCTFFQLMLNFLSLLFLGVQVYH